MSPFDQRNIWKKHTWAKIVFTLFTLILTFTLSDSSRITPLRNAALAASTNISISQEEVLSSKLVEGGNDGLGLTLRGQIGGRINKLVVQGNFAYFVNGPRVLFFDLSDLAQPVKTGQTDVMPDVIENLTVVDSFLFTANGFSGIHIVDVSQPQATENVASIDTPGFAYDVDIQGDYAYVADSSNGLRIYNIENRVNPDVDYYPEVGYLDTASLSLRSVVVNGNYAYVSNWNGTRVDIIDISDPSIPTVVGGYDTGSYPFDLEVSDQYLYIADRDNGLIIVDVSDPGQVVEVGSQNTPGEAYDVEISSTHAYIADRTFGVRIIDISNPAVPQETGAYAATVKDVQSVAYIENNILLADVQQGLKIIDASNPSAPSLKSSYDLLGYAKDVSIKDNVAFIAGSARGIVSVDISDISNLSEIGFYSSAEGVYEAIEVKGNYAYAVDNHCCPSQENLEVINITNPANLTRLGDAISVGGSGATQEIVALEERLYLAKAQGGLLIYNTTVPEFPFLDGTFMTDPTQGHFRDVALDGRYAYLPDQDGGYLRVVDTFIISNPIQVGFEDISNTDNLYKIAIQGNYAYLPSSYNFHVANISDPENPVLVSSTRNEERDWGGIVDIQLIENYAFLTFGSEQISVLDVANPEHPVEIGRYNLPGTLGGYSRIRVLGNLVFVADIYGGLFILEWSGPFQLKLPFANSSANDETRDLFTRYNGQITSAFDHNEPGDIDNKMLSYLGYTPNCNTTFNPEDCEYDAHPLFSWPDNVVCRESIKDCYPGHSGIDFSGKRNDGYVYPAAPGVVEDAKWFTGGYGNMVVVDHGNGYVTRYAHLASFNVSAGQQVDVNTKLGEIGGTGGNYSPHIHLEVWYDDGFQRYLLDPSGWKDITNTDPWMHPNGTSSYNMWVFEIPKPETVSLEGDAGGTYTFVSNISISFAAGAFSGAWDFVYTDTPVSEPSNGLLSTGYSFTFEGNQATQAFTKLGASTGEFTITVPYSTADLVSINESSLGIYLWDSQSETWLSLATELDAVNNIVTATTNQFGLFALFGAYEDTQYLPLIVR